MKTSTYVAMVQIALSNTPTPTRADVLHVVRCLWRGFGFDKETEAAIVAEVCRIRRVPE